MPFSLASSHYLDIAGGLAHNARQAATVAGSGNDKAQLTIGNQLAQPLGGRHPLCFSL